MPHAFTIYDADPVQRLSRAVESDPRAKESMRPMQRMRRTKAGGKRMMAAFGGDNLVELAQEFLDVRGNASGDLLVLHVDRPGQLDAVIVVLHALLQNTAEVRALAAPSPEALRRLVRGHANGIPEQTIVDAQCHGRTLYLTDAELQRHVVDCDKVRPLHPLSTAQLATLQVDSIGRFVAWPETDIEMTLRALRQATDDTYRAETTVAELQRASDYGHAIRRVREQSDIRQADIPGLSERQLRRIEAGTAQPSTDAMQALADRHAMSLNDYLSRVAAERALQKV